MEALAHLCSDKFSFLKPTKYDHPASTTAMETVGVHRPWSAGILYDISIDIHWSTVIPTLPLFINSILVCRLHIDHQLFYRFPTKDVWEAAKVTLKAFEDPVTKNTTAQHNTQPSAMETYGVRPPWSARMFYKVSFPQWAAAEVLSKLRSTLPEDNLTGNEDPADDGQEPYILFPKQAAWEAAKRILTETLGPPTGGTADPTKPLALRKRPLEEKEDPPRAQKRQTTKAVVPLAKSVPGRLRPRNRNAPKTEHPAVQSQGEMTNQHKRRTKAPGVGRPLSKHGSVPRQDPDTVSEYVLLHSDTENHDGGTARVRLRERNCVKTPVARRHCHRPRQTHRIEVLARPHTKNGR